MNDVASETVLSNLPNVSAPPAASTVPFDVAAFDAARATSIRASRSAGNVHLDRVSPYVESMRGREIFYVHDPKVTGVIRTVDAHGNVYVNWADAYSAEKELASPTLDGRQIVFRSSLGRGNLKDYALASTSTRKPA